MESTDTPRPAQLPGATNVIGQDVEAMPGPDELYANTSIESNMASVAFDERVELETRFYAAVLGFMSFGGIGWICLCIGAGLNFLLS